VYISAIAHHGRERERERERDSAHDDITQTPNAGLVPFFAEPVAIMTGSQPAAAALSPPAWEPALQREPEVEARMRRVVAAAIAASSFGFRA